VSEHNDQSALLENGLCRRGEHMHKSGELPKPFSPPMLVNFVKRLSVEKVEAFFNNVIKALAKFGIFPKEITAILDGSDLETTEKYKRYGRAKRTKKYPSNS